MVRYDTIQERKVAMDTRKKEKIVILVSAEEKEKITLQISNVSAWGRKLMLDKLQERNEHR